MHQSEPVECVRFVQADIAQWKASQDQGRRLGNKEIYSDRRVAAEHVAKVEGKENHWNRRNCSA